MKLASRLVVPTQWAADQARPVRRQARDLSAQLPVAIRPLSTAELICMLIYLVLLVFVVLVCRSCVIPPAADLHSFFPVQSPVVGTKSV